MKNILLEVNDLNISFQTKNGMLHAVKNLSFQLNAGETLGIVGETGSGKSVTALSILRLLPTATVTGKIVFHSGTAGTGNNAPNPLSVLDLPENQMRRLRGSAIAMIFQEPMTSLNPVFRCGFQIEEALRLHQNCSHQEAKARTMTLLEQVKITQRERIYRSYPHQLSGGQKQRIMIAMAMAGQPALLIADEPTTALDVTVQKEILDLMAELRDETGMSMLFISHDLGVISEVADRVIVMSLGEIVETGPTGQILHTPQHPYTQGLVSCRPSMQQKMWRLPTLKDFQEPAPAAPRVYSSGDLAKHHDALYQQTPLLQVRDISVRYPVRKNWFGQPDHWLTAVDRVSFEVYPGEIFGLAGESGSGKTTLARVVSRLIAHQEGRLWYRQLDLDALPEAEFRSVRREIQMVFQDPYSSLNPRMTIGETLLEPMKAYALYGAERDQKKKVLELLDTVGLEAAHAGRYPREFSGGQRQRICLARALALQPRLLICDEIVSALDVSVQATILNLLLDLREAFGLTYLFISHDLSVMRQMCDRVLVMKNGRQETVGFPEDLFARPENQYVRELLAALPGR